MVVVKVLDDKEGASASIHEICQKFPDSNFVRQKIKRKIMRNLRHLLFRNKSAYLV